MTQNKSTQEIAAVLFDLDGTLAHTAPDLCNAMNQLLREEGRQPIRVEEICAGVSYGGIGLLDQCFEKDMDDKRRQHLLERFLNHYDRTLCVETRLYSGVPEVLRHLDQSAIAWGIVTNKRQRFADPIASRLFKEYSHACLVCGDTTPTPKPDPTPLLYAARLLSMEARHCVYVGDSKNDIVAAHAAGMRAIAVRYGYGNYAGTPDGPDNWGAHAVLTEITDLLTWLNDEAE